MEQPKVKVIHLLGAVAMIGAIEQPHLTGPL